MGSDYENSYQDYYKGKKILLFGGLGFVGKCLMKKFVDLKANVTIVNRDANNVKKLPKSKVLRNECKFISLDLFKDFNYFKEYIKEADIILNLVHCDSKDFSFQQKMINFNFQLLNFCYISELNPVLVHFGSRMEYSKKNPLPISEEGMLKPDTAYGLGKLISEYYFKFFSENFKLRTICLRISNIYGLDNIREGKNIINFMIKSALEGNIKIDQDIYRYKDFIYVGDLIEALLLCIKNSNCYGKIFNLGSGEGVMLKQLAEKIRKVFKQDTNIEIDESENKKDFSFYLDISKAKKEFGWEPKINMDEGLELIKKELMI